MNIVSRDLIQQAQKMQFDPTILYSDIVCNWAAAERENLPTEMQDMIKSSQKVCKNEKDYYHLLEFLRFPEVWRFPRVSVETFIDDKYYLGLGEQVRPFVRQMCIDIINGRYREAVLVAGIGLGKSYLSAILSTYLCQHLLCLRNPHQYYGLTKDKAISIINMGITATQAQDVVFSSTKSFVEGTPFFQEWKPRIQAGVIHFDKHAVTMMSGNSKSTTPLGYNVFGGILDEAAFYMDNEHKSVAEDIYSGLQRRITSRFGRDGLLMMISSPRYTEDFIMRKLDESRAIATDGKRVQEHVYSKQSPTWKSKLPTKDEFDKRFYFNCRTNQILEETEAEIRATYKVNDIYYPEFDSTYDVWEIPGEYYSSFRSNPEKSKRDYGAVPSVSIGGFFPMPGIVKAAFNTERVSPLVSPGVYKFDYRPMRVPYFIHIDIGFNRDQEGDYTGFCMGRFDGYYTDEVTGETKMKFHIDVMERIGISSEKGEVDLAEVRQRIYDLKAMGFNISLVTLDGYQSKDFMQTLKKKGFRADYLSVDREVDAYNALKEAIYDKRIDMYHYQPVEDELVRLELIKGIKVDHPPGGYKDASDALAGVVMNIINETKGAGVNIMHATPSDQAYGGNLALQQEAEIRKKKEHYERVQRITNRQNDIANRMGL